MLSRAALDLHELDAVSSLASALAALSGLASLNSSHGFDSLAMT